jgi:hypothetical protein
MTGCIGTSVTVSLNYNQYIAIADLHTVQFTVAHALITWEDICTEACFIT